MRPSQRIDNVATFCEIALSEQQKCHYRVGTSLSCELLVFKVKRKRLSLALRMSIYSDYLATVNIER